MAERKSARPIEELDVASQARLKSILAKDPESLITAGDRAFLEARRDYLTEDERADFEVDGEVSATEDGDEYDDMTADELKDELRERGLKVGGKVDELRDRLRADDDEEDAEDGE